MWNEPQYCISALTLTEVVCAGSAACVLETVALDGHPKATSKYEENTTFNLGLITSVLVKDHPA